MKFSSNLPVKLWSPILIGDHVPALYNVESPTELVQAVFGVGRGEQGWEDATRDVSVLLGVKQVQGVGSGNRLVHFFLSGSLGCSTRGTRGRQWINNLPGNGVGGSKGRRWSAVVSCTATTTTAQNCTITRGLPKK